MSLSVHALHTSIFRVGGNLLEFIVNHVQAHLIHERMIIAVTSKIVSVAEGRIVSRESIDKKTLVQKEADVYLGEAAYGCFLTIKHGLLIPSSGIDESNSESGDYILYPEDPAQSAQTLWSELRRIWKLENLGILITDSHTTPLRRGVTGVCLSYAGFQGVRSLVGAPDLFGSALKVTQVNYADGLAATAVMLMGEGAEACPLAVIENAPVEFAENTDLEEMHIPLEQDLYFPLFQQLQATQVSEKR